MPFWPFRRGRAGGTAFSCVVDNDVVMRAQSYVWLTALLSIQRCTPGQIFVHLTEGAEHPDYLALLERLGVTVVRIAPFDSRNPYCNKLAQLPTFLETPFRQVVLMDCDTAWIGSKAMPATQSVAAKVVDFANPPPPVLEDVFQLAGLGDPDWTETSFPTAEEDGRSDRNNCNGGVYIFEQSSLRSVAPLWQKWAAWCIDHAEAFGDYSKHADQVSFALALRELNGAIEPLPLAWNYPTHLPASLLPDVEPQILHFHRELTTDFALKPTGVALVDTAIARMNDAVQASFSRHLTQALFWDLRYALDPDRGSGLGSRGSSLTVKQRLLEYSTFGFEDKSVLDIGCGDLEATRQLVLPKYVGIDASAEALKVARAKRPDLRFETEWDGEQADAVICLDVLIHQTSENEFDGLLQRLTTSARERLIVSGYNAKNDYDSPIVAFHRPLREELEASGIFQEVLVVGSYRDVDVVVADKRSFGAAFHPNDIDAASFNRVARLTPRPDLLRHLADVSRASFGFYTKHVPRAIEYPWLAAKLEPITPGTSVLEVGAGLNPLPVFLAARGAQVVTLDPHPSVRVPPFQPDWNEWGFFDYSWFGPRLESRNVGIESFASDGGFDVVYSVSVFEHLPRSVWELALERSRAWLGTDGRLLLTVDLVPETELLWNLAEGVEVEPAAEHGTVDDLVQSIERLGFVIDERTIMRGVPESRTDLCFLDCVVGGKGTPPSGDLESRVED
jgi:2-polyprenyl-3-methyl-5-hydroxy-6-metoxy-1,4-benzoquinol methylase